MCFIIHYIIIQLFAGLFNHLLLHIASKLCCFLELSITRNRADIPGVLVELFGAFEAIGILLFGLTVLNILHWFNIQLIIIARFYFTL